MEVQKIKKYMGGVNVPLIFLKENIKYMRWQNIFPK